MVTTNNLASTFVTVREGGIRILYLRGAKRIGGRAAGREQRFVRGTLATSPDMIVTSRLIDYTPSEADLTGELTADRWDVIVLDDVDTTGLSTASWQAIVDSVRKGTGLLVTGGYHSFGPGGYSGNRIESVLPLTFNGLDRQRFGEPIRNDVHLQPPVSLVPTQLGLAHPVLRIVPPSDLESAWQELPPLDGANLFSKSDLKPLAQVLADSGPPSRKPLLIAGQGGNGRVMVFAGDSTWRWQMQGHDNEFQRFWRQMMLWLARKEAREQGRVYIDLSTRSISRGGLLELEVGFDRSDNEQERELSFDVTVTTPAGEAIPVDTSGSEPDRQAGSFSSTIQPGDYLVQATVRSGDQEIDSAQARFLVPEEDLELDRPAADPGLMAQLAATTADAGGQSLAPEELGTLIADLADRPIDTTEDVLARVTYWDKWPFFLAFMAVVSTEWWLRKRWGLV